MNETNKIDPNLFFGYLKLEPFFLPFKTQEQKRLAAVFAYWDRNHAGDDERKLAHVLAAVHHRTKEADERSRVPSENVLADYFDVDPTEWSDVKEIEWKVVGPSYKDQLADMFYTVLANIRPVPLSRVLSEELERTRGVTFTSRNLEQIFQKFHEQ